MGDGDDPVRRHPRLYDLGGPLDSPRGGRLPERVLRPGRADPGGHANKLLGDGLLGVFGAPERLPDHADRALAAAEDMLAALESRFGQRCRIGIGINSGLVLVGTVGGGGLTEYGVIGDPVNVAARVQDATRELGEPLLLTEATRCLLEDSETGLKAHGSLRLKGKGAPVAICGVDSRNASRTPTA